VLLDALEAYKKKPLTALFDRFPQMTADLAARMGKRVAPLAVKGGEILVAADEFEEVISSFSHLVRNMVDHGIELPGEREAKGKKPEGTLSIDITAADNEVVFTFSDDGRGVQLDKVERRAREIGLLKDGESADPRELLGFIFRDNFSTSTSVSHVSGRGVGLAAVQEAVRKIGGRIAVKSAADRGTVFTIAVPLRRVRQGEAVA
jgi:two-component system chemotaxis sensor kinase CheA